MKGPAAAMSIMSFIGFLRLNGLTGTGFAHPKKAPPKKVPSSGSNIVPMASICTAGLSDMRPKFFAVGSPSISADFACPHS